VALQNSFDTSADKWSLGCVLFDLATCTPLFQVKSYYDLIASFHHMVGPIPRDLLQNFERRDQLFEFPQEDPSTVVLRKEVQLKISLKEHMKSCFTKTLTNPNGVQSSGLKSPEFKVFINFLNGLLQLNPADRLSYEEMLNNDFISNYT